MVYVVFGTGFEEIEALTPVDLLRRAGIDVVTIGIGSRAIRGAHDIVVNTDITDADIETEGLEMVVLPGGLGGTASIQACDNVIRLVRYAYEHGQWVSAICAAPTILGSLGMLRGHEAICYPGNESLLEGAVIVDADTVTDGMIITGRAAGASIPFALELIKALKGAEASETVREKICYR